MTSEEIRGEEFVGAKFCDEASAPAPTSRREVNPVPSVKLFTSTLVI